MAGNKNSGRKNWEKPISDALRRKVLENDAKALNTLINVWVSKAMAGDMQALGQILDRLEGKPVQQIEAHNVNENHFVKAPEKASKDDWAQYLAHKTKAPVDKIKIHPPPATAGKHGDNLIGANGKPNNGKSH